MTKTADFYRCRVCGNEFEEAAGKWGCCDTFPAVLITSKPVITFKLIQDFGNDWGKVMVFQDGKKLTTFQPLESQAWVLGKLWEIGHSNFGGDGFILPYTLDEDDFLKPMDISQYQKPGQP